ncbi:MAG: HPF/RaiA family ribosome-associated protein [Planctomycetaceae bacterium]
MHISISGPDEIRSNGFQDSVANRLMRALTRFSRRIDRVDVAITDENGSRGGIDKHCRIRVQMPGVEPFVATAKDESPWAAVSRAVERARRKVTTRLKRPRSRRERFRRNRWQDNDTPDL